jgi:FkbM family methyltransferase
VNILTKIIRTLWIPEYRRALLRARVFASTEHDQVIDELGVDTVVDIGANRGQFALCARRLYPNAKIFSFEPLRIPAKSYRKLFGKDPRARLIGKAISNAQGSASMYVSRWDVSSSILPFAQAQHDNFPFTEESRRETVSVATLSDCLGGDDIKGTALLKLDVQGYELTALHGCQELLAKFRYIYVEASFVELYVGQALAADVIGYLFSKGFRLICVANLSKGKAKRPIQADFLFVAAQTS